LSPTVSIARMAMSRRFALAMPWISSPYSTLPRMVRLGNSAKLWKTMPNFARRNSRSALPESPVTSVPSTTTLPLDGSISRLTQRSRVDLPEPDRPMTTRISPSATSNETLCRPTTAPVLACTSARSAPD
jgi:hypothetical protein